MKKMRKLLAALIVFALVLAVFPAKAVKADGEQFDGEAKVFIAFGGDVEAENDWGYSYCGDGCEGNAGDIVGTDATIKVGETVTVSVEFPKPVVNAWYFAPVIIAENIGELDATVSVKIDGNDVAIDASQGDAWWYEATGDYDDKQAIRLAGGFNEWGAQYIEEPSQFTKIEYTITLNSASVKEAAEVVESDFDGEADVFIGFGGDAAEENDWALCYNDPDNEGNNKDIVATNAKIKVGDTVTVSLEFPSEVFNTWWMAPVLVAEGITDLDATVSLKIDDKEVAIDASKGDAWWYEQTGDIDDKHAVRLAGGFNEWGTQYIEEPANFKKVEYTITLNSAKVGTAVEEAGSAAGEVDKNGTYNAYIGIQTPKYSFRNAWYDSYGRDDADNPDFFGRVTAWNEANEAYGIPGTIQDAEIKGNGTYTVSITGIEFPENEFKDQENMNLIFVSTDIPNTGDIVISDMVLKINGSSVSIAPVISPDSEDYLVMLIQNIWNEDVKEIGYYNVPFSDISITFTVSGFDYDNETTEEVTEAATEVTEATEATTEATEAATEASTEAAKQEGGLGAGAIAGIAAAAVAVIGGGAFALSKKKKDE